MIHAGRLNQRIALLRPAVTRSDIGEEVLAYRSTMTVWAEVKAVRGDERLIANELIAESTIMVTMRYVAKLTAKYRLRWNGHDWNILEVRDDGRRESLILVAIKVQA